MAKKAKKKKPGRTAGTAKGGDGTAKGIHQRRQHRAAAVKQEVAEEILALEAIYGEDFALHEDGIGFALHIVPHPGALEDNYCSVQLHVRYSADYPAAALQLHIRDADGLLLDEARRLTQQLSESAAQHAKQEAVCVFDLVDECQDFLREHNDLAEERAAAARLSHMEGGSTGDDVADGDGSGDSSGTAPQSLWHAMQERLAAAEAQAEEAQGGALVGLLGDDAWAFDGGLFADEGGWHVLPICGGN